MAEVREVLRRVLPDPVISSLRDMNWHWLMNYGRKSYSQEGEDIFLNNIFRDQRTGFYVDVGAHHPVHYSNTFLFYRRGWRGINIDPTPGSKRLFERRRPRDITLEIGVGASSSLRSFYTFDHSVFNTVDETERDFAIASGAVLCSRSEIKIERLDKLLERHLHGDQSIDFMSIDVEGSEEDVILSNDWNRFRAKMLCVEILHATVDEIKESAAAKLLARAGYVFCAKIDHTSFFRDENFHYS